MGVVYWVNTCVGSNMAQNVCSPSSSSSCTGSMAQNIWSPSPSSSSTGSGLSETESSSLTLSHEEDSEDQVTEVSKVRVDYKEFFELSCRWPTTNCNCLARCKLCWKSYKFILTTKGNLLKDLQTTHIVGTFIFIKKKEQRHLKVQHNLTRVLFSLVTKGQWQLLA